MNSQQIKTLILILALFAVTCTALAFNQQKPSPPEPPLTHGGGSPHLQATASLVQSKFAQHSDGIVDLSLTLSSSPRQKHIVTEETANHVDLVIVLDRSGSMEGEKIRDAKQAVSNLLEQLREGDRIALVSYSNDVQTNLPLAPVDQASRAGIYRQVESMRAGGGTNLGGGLAAGIQILASRGQSAGIGKVILLSDGIANQGITDHVQLADMAGRAMRQEFSISTVGVGNDFNEVLMTLLADHGGGTYHYLEDAAAISQVLMEEFSRSSSIVANNIEVSLPLPEGVFLQNASGYPISTNNGRAVFRPGAISTGQTRTFHLAIQFPSHTPQSFSLEPISIRYTADGKESSFSIDERFTVACVADKAQAIASIDKGRWEEKVIKEDANKLREEVAADIKAGKKEEAKQKIDVFKTKQTAANEYVQSPAVSGYLEKDLSKLASTVEQAFDSGTATQQQAAKAIQYEGYQARRK